MKPILMFSSLKTLELSSLWKEYLFFKTQVYQDQKNEDPSMCALISFHNYLLYK
jgi:hypothetical protein